MKTNPLPSWGRHFFAARKVAVIEEVEVDRDGKVRNQIDDVNNQRWNWDCHVCQQSMLT